MIDKSTHIYHAKAMNMSDVDYTSDTFKLISSNICNGHLNFERQRISIEQWKEVQDFILLAQTTFPVIRIYLKGSGILSESIDPRILPLVMF